MSENKWWREEGERDPHDQLVIMLAEYRDAVAELKPAVDRLEAMKAEVKRLALELNEDVTIEGASITMRPGYQRSQWNGKALDGYAAAHPELEQFKKVVNVKATAAIKIN